MSRFIRCVAIVLSVMLIPLAPATAQEIDFSGQWVPIFHEDGPERLPGPEIADYATDAGMQTRLFRFATPGPPGVVTLPAQTERTWQRQSVARWEAPPRAAAGSGIPLGLAPRAGTQSRTLEVVTTQIRPGYLRKNGVPFSPNATVTEYCDLFEEPGGANWFVVTTIVTDPQYLNTPWVTTSHFKKEADGSKWDPQPCAVR